MKGQMVGTGTESICGETDVLGLSQEITCSIPGGDPEIDQG